jgi:hypothetical protein
MERDQTGGDGGQRQAGGVSRRRFAYHAGPDGQGADVLTSGKAPGSTEIGGAHGGHADDGARVDAKTWHIVPKASGDWCRGDVHLAGLQVEVVFERIPRHRHVVRRWRTVLAAELAD